tara:strand:- start:297 stop:557 length:261 start_codon:yes stop_codon:yes gene_type:complete
MELNDRERFILHSTAVLTVDLIVKKLKSDPISLNDMNGMTESNMFEMMESIRKGRCRKLSIDNMMNLYDEMKDEMMIGGELYKNDM